jgi:hypothetical protein
MARPNSTTAGVCGFAQDDSITWRDRFDVLLCERPARFDWIQVRRVRRQVFDASIGPLDQRNDATVVMSLGVVENDDVAEFELRNQALANPSNEAIGIRRFEDRAHRDPTRETHGTDHREARAPIHWPWIDELFAATNPCVRATHREIRRGFVKEYEP